MMIKCRECGAPITPDTPVCLQCGLEKPQVWNTGTKKQAVPQATPQPVPASSYDALVEQARMHMDSGERVIAFVKGTYVPEILGSASVRSGVLIATDRRVVFYAKKFTGHDFEVFPYSNISSVDGGKNLMGHHLTLYATGNKAHMKWIKAGDVDLFLREVRNRIGKKEQVNHQPVPAPVQESIIDQIKKLGELKDAGILTDDEFSAKKAELLARL